MKGRATKDLPYEDHRNCDERIRALSNDLAQKEQERAYLEVQKNALEAELKRLYEQGWKARAEKAEAEVERLKARETEAELLIERARPLLDDDGSTWIRDADRWIEGGGRDSGGADSSVRRPAIAAANPAAHECPRHPGMFGPCLDNDDPPAPQERDCGG